MVHSKSKKGSAKKGISEVISTVILSSVIIAISIIVFYYAMYSFEIGVASTEYGYDKSVLLDIASNFNHILLGSQYYSSISTKTVGIGYHINDTDKLVLAIPAYNITIQIINTGNNTLKNIVVPIILTPLNFTGWTYISVGSYIDISFVTSTFDKLQYSLISYVPGAYIEAYVLIPRINAGEVLTIYMYYGPNVIEYNSTLSLTTVPSSLKVSTTGVNGTGLYPIYVLYYKYVYVATYNALTTSSQILYGTNNYTVNDIRLLPRVIEYYKLGVTYASLDTFRYNINIQLVQNSTSSSYIITVLGADINPELMSTTPNTIVVATSGIERTYTNINATSLYVIVISNNLIVTKYNIFSQYNITSANLYVNIKKVNVVLI